MLLRTSILLLALTGSVGPAAAASDAKTCALSDQQFATAINTLREWSRIHAFYKTHFPPCPDDGMFAEGYSELIVRTLATNWGNLSELGAAARQDKRFKSFVLRHIDATTNEADLRAILASATSSCARGNAALCSQIRRATSAAIRELR